MNYNQEMENELRALGLGGRIFEIPEGDKGTPEDWAKLERKVSLCTRENEIMMTKSVSYAQEGLPLG